jgi:hypothetical protein
LALVGVKWWGVVDKRDRVRLGEDLGGRDGKRDGARFR